MRLRFTLRTRLFLLLAAAMLLSALAWAAIFTYSEREPRARQLAQLLTSVANLTRSAVVAADPSRRIELFEELSRQEGIRIYVAEDDDRIKPPGDDAFLQQVQQQLASNLGGNVRLSLELNGERAIFLRVPIDHDAYWIVLPLERLNHSHSLQWIGWGALAALIALFAATLFVARLTRPLRSLARAAGEIGAGGRPAPLQASGPDELRAVAHAFNQMNADLAQLDQDRALILAGVSHDLRTPLTRLRMGIELSVGDDEMRRGMEADVEEMDRTIGQFLDFARADDGEPAQATDARDLLDELARQYARRNVPVKARLDQVPTLSLRPKALRRAIANLIDNALRHAGGSQIDLSLRRIDGALAIEVADRGPGIPPEEAERLKRPFTRMDAARSNTGGAGLGLAIVERVARQHGGHLELAMRDGGGLIARVTISAK
ncbi:MAG: ATP-binding protein [Rhodocyclaceae bacterium]|nr:ATP-binding protein [Rhodocyclaceae bacterium]